MHDTKIVSIDFIGAAIAIFLTWWGLPAVSIIIKILLTVFFILDGCSLVPAIHLIFKRRD